MLSSQGGVSTDIEQSYTASVLNAAKVRLIDNDFNYHNYSILYVVLYFFDKNI